jgi:hypothetical protein
MIDACIVSRVSQVEGKVASKWGKKWLFRLVMLPLGDFDSTLVSKPLWQTPEVC